MLGSKQYYSLLWFFAFFGRLVIFLVICFLIIWSSGFGPLDQLTKKEAMVFSIYESKILDLVKYNIKLFNVFM